MLRRKIGIVFQDFQLLMERNVFANLDFVLRATGWKDAEDREERIDKVLEEVGMANKSYKMPQHRHLLAAQRRKVVVKDTRIPGHDRHLSVKRFEQGRLARPHRANKIHHLAGLHTAREIPL